MAAEKGFYYTKSDNVTKESVVHWITSFME